MSSGVFVEIEVEESVLKRAGYHHQDDCEMPPDYHDELDCPSERLLRALKVMHDEHHEGPSRFCPHEPCRGLL